MSLTNPEILFQEHVNNVGEFFEQNSVEKNGEVVLREGAVQPAMPQGILFKGAPSNGEQFIQELANKLSIGYDFQKFEFGDYAENIHYLFSSQDSDWAGVDASVYVFEELDEEGRSYFADGSNPDAHWSSKLLLIITSDLVGALSFLPNADGLEDLDIAFVIDRNADKIVEMLESVEEDEEDGYQ